MINYSYQSLIFAVTINDGNLFCQPTGQPTLELSPISKNEFNVKRIDAKISFIKGSNQNVEKLILNQGGNKIPALKIK